MKPLAALTFTIALAGCASHGVMVSDQQAAQFKRGETTEAEIIATLGAPTVTTTINGQRSISYNGAQVQARPASFIPFIGPFVGGADVRASSVVFRFDGSGKLAETVSNQHASATGTGLAAGSPISQVEAQPRKPEGDVGPVTK
jgi:outer membrane protein assembly factor BamE (lipoprotein component of BamABCDE complex)